MNETRWYIAVGSLALVTALLDLTHCPMKNVEAILQMYFHAHLQINIMNIFCEIGLKWVIQGAIDIGLGLVPSGTWASADPCRSMSPYDVASQQLVNIVSYLTVL